MQIVLPPRDGERPTVFELEGQVYGCYGTIRDYVSSLTAEELHQVRNSVSKRRIEYATGRHFARCALTRLGHRAIAIPSGASRQPLWPTGIIGSISHSDSLAIALVAHEIGRFVSLGVDIEPRSQLAAELTPMVLTEREFAHARHANDPFYPALVFSAKEAVYKATHPVTWQMIGFHEVEIHTNAANRTFAATYLGNDARNAVMEFGTGGFGVYEDHFVCAFSLDKAAFRTK